MGATLTVAALLGILIIIMGKMTDREKYPLLRALDLAVGSFILGCVFAAFLHYYG